jgi:hypothetical protein
MKRGRTNTTIRAVVCAVALASVLAACGHSSRKVNAVAPTTLPPTTAAPTTTAPPPAVFPLTGLPTNAGPALRPALSVKVDNVAGSFPQAGLNDADIVTEALVEGGLTRLFVTYQSHDAGRVGPIRSARPVDADLLDQLGGGIFAYSGAAPGEIAPVQDHSHATLLSMDAGVDAFYRDRSRPAPHNVFASTAALYDAGAAAGDHSSAPPQQFQFGPLANATPAANANVPMGNRASAAWHWNALSGLFERDQNGGPDMLDDGSRITADNVLMLSVGIQGTGVFDVTGVEDPLPVVIGEGPCWLLRDGQLVQGKWSRPSTNAPTTYTDTTGAPMLLHPGRTWVELVQNSLQPSFG